MREAIGGYFELELRRGHQLYPQALAFNAARWAFRAFVLNSGLRTVYLPYFICDVLAKSISDLNIKIERYALNEALELSSLPHLERSEAVLYVDYFGLKRDYVANVLIDVYGESLIVDNSQALFSPAATGIPTLYSPRKFVGVADGGWLLNGSGSMAPAQCGLSAHRFSALLGRLEQRPNEHYAAFQACEESIEREGMCQMSASTARVLDSIDYSALALQRIKNLKLLRTRLDKLNQFTAWPTHDIPALCYPLLVETPALADALRQYLLEQTIYVPCYWREVAENPAAPAFEQRLSRCLLPLPIDQRYGGKAMNRLADAVLNCMRTA